MEEESMIKDRKAAAMEGGGGGGGGCSAWSQLRSSGSSGCNKPAWLLSSLADLDDRIKALVLNSYDDKDQLDQADTFAQRAEFYYQQRPQLLSLLQDLYNTYLSLADRYSQSLHKHHHHHQQQQQQCGTRSSENLSNDEDYQSDAESSLSYQLPSTAPLPAIQQCTHNDPMDQIIAELVIKNVEYDLTSHELGVMLTRDHESSRKIELQRSLLEVLESERLILLNENVGLRCKVGALVQENKGLASESMFMKRKAGELARCVLKMREDHRVCMLNRKVEDLQGKIYGLEERNREYYKELVKREKAQAKCPSCRGSERKENKIEGVDTEACFQGGGEKGKKERGVKVSKWWDKVKKSDLLFLCKPHPSKPLGHC